MMHFVELIEESNKITNLPEMIGEAKTLVKQLIDETNEGTNKIFSQKMCYHQQFCCLNKYQKQKNHGLFENIFYFQWY